MPVTTVRYDEMLAFRASSKVIAAARECAERRGLRLSEFAREAVKRAVEEEMGGQVARRD